MNWIPYPIVLSGKLVNLISLDSSHTHELEILAKDKRIWEHYVYDASNTEKFNSIVEAAFLEQQRGTQFPFVIFHKSENRLLGSTRFMDIQFAHRKLEIGSTWLHPDYWGTAANLECKLILLTYCFEVLKTVRVQFKTDENNVRSRKALEKIGGRFEGIMQHDMLRDNGTKRNSAYYSIIDTEWSEKKKQLTNLLDAKMSSVSHR